MSVKRRQKKVSPLSKVLLTKSGSRLGQKTYLSSKSSSQMINLAKARDMLYYSGETSATSLITYKGPRIKTIADWQAADADTRRQFALQMDIAGPIEAARRSKSKRVGPSNPRSMCPICAGLGYLEKKNRNTGYMHPSELNTCAIRLLHSWVADPFGRISEPSPTLQGVFDIGTVAHLLYQWYAHDTFEDTDVNFQSEVEFRPPRDVDIPDVDGEMRREWPPISGYADGQVEGKDFKFILEIKIVKRITDVTSISKDYLMQQIAYARMLDAPGVLFVFLEKSDPNRIEQVFCGYSQELWESIERKLMSVIDPFVTKGRWPEKTATTSTCKNCPYGKTCDVSPFYEGEEYEQKQRSAQPRSAG